MKTLYQIALYFITLMSLTIISCNKKEMEATSYFRNQYIGDWHFDVSVSEFNMMDSTFSHDVLSYEGRVDRAEGPTQLRILYGPGNSMVLTVAENGQLSGFGSLYSSGSFIGNDSLHIYHRTGGLGGCSTTIIDGKRH